MTVEERTNELLKMLNQHGVRESKFRERMFYGRLSPVEVCRAIATEESLAVPDRISAS